MGFDAGWAKLREPFVVFFSCRPLTLEVFRCAVSPLLRVVITHQARIEAQYSMSRMVVQRRCRML
jgi:hypothetical protein